MQEQAQPKKIITDKLNNFTYAKGKLLGSGGFAKCYEIVCQENSNIYAAKVIPKRSIAQKRQRHKLISEIKIHRSLQHKHIVGFRDAFEDKENVYILLEYCRNYTLKDLVKRRKRLTELQAKIYTSQLVKALMYIHSQSIIHRDLKLGNILINDRMQTKICDFGLSTRIKQEDQTKKTVCGTPNYIAPQILDGNGHSYEVDIWSIGVILYALLFGRPPFEDYTIEQTYENIQKNKFIYPNSVTVSENAKNLISKILVTDPSRRLTLVEILDHQFMKVNGEALENLPISTLAIPPVIKIQNKLDTSQIYESYAFSMQNQSITVLRENLKIEIADDRFKQIYVRECFFAGEFLGYLLSNGVVGVFNKKSSMNAMLEYGSANYVTVIKNKIEKHFLPSNNDEVNSLRRIDYLQALLNFKSYFSIKYGYFRLDEMWKKQLNKEVFENQFFYIKKCLKFTSDEILVRINNSVIQLHFKDLTAMMTDKIDGGDMYYMDEKGRVEKMKGERQVCKNRKRKGRKLRRIVQKLSGKGKEGSECSSSSQESEELLIL